MVDFIKKRLLVSPLLFFIGIAGAYAHDSGRIDYNFSLSADSETGQAFIHVESEFLPNQPDTRLLVPSHTNVDLVDKEEKDEFSLKYTGTDGSFFIQDGGDLVLNGPAGAHHKFSYDVPIPKPVHFHSFYKDIGSDSLAFEANYLFFTPHDTDRSWDISVTSNFNEASEHLNYTYKFDGVSGDKFRHKHLSWCDMHSVSIDEGALNLHVEKSLSYPSPYHDSIQKTLSVAKAAVDNFADRPYTEAKDVYIFSSGHDYLYYARNQGSDITLYMPPSEEAREGTNIAHVIFHEFMHQWFGSTVLPMLDIATSEHMGTWALLEGLTDFYALKFTYEKLRTKKEEYQQEFFSNFKAALQKSYLRPHGRGNAERRILPMHMLLRYWLQSGKITQENLDAFSLALPEEPLTTEQVVALLEVWFGASVSNDFQYYILEEHNVLEASQDEVTFKGSHFPSLKNKDS